MVWRGGGGEGNGDGGADGDEVRAARDLRRVARSVRERGAGVERPRGEPQHGGREQQRAARARGGRNAGGDPGRDGTAQGRWLCAAAAHRPIGGWW